MVDQKGIRNFAIIAHVDHGKSTLADRLLELTNTVRKETMVEQFLDRNPISRERGITIKLAPVRMRYKIPNSKSQIPNNFQYQNPKAQNSLEFGASDLGFANSEYILNLIDTPGHVDFSYEVSRTLAACEGVVLLVDATQGIQAQTVAHYRAAKAENLVIIPVMNKIDLSNSRPNSVAKSLSEMFFFKKEEISSISAKTGENVPKLLEKIVEKIPSPRQSCVDYLRALIFDAVYDQHRGVIAFVRIMDGEIKKGDKVSFFQSKAVSDVLEVGYFSPFLTPCLTLATGEIGYIVTGIKDLKMCNVGDTVTRSKIKNQRSKTDEKVRPLPGYKKPKPMVFFGMFPKSTDELVRLKEGLLRVSLTDSALSFQEEHSEFLGNGFRVGFLGLLHAEIIKERLKQEENVEPLLTMPQVLYEKKADGKIFEPFMNISVYSPVEYVGGIMSVCQKRQGKLLDMIYHDTYAILQYEMPYSMLIQGLSSKIKSNSSGFASFDYEITDYKEADLVKLDVLINNMPIDVLSELFYRDSAIYHARRKVEKLKEALPRRQIKQIIQGLVDGTIVARSEVAPFRKDVLAKMSGGDRTRKDKLLGKQRKGKERLLKTTKIDIPQEALFSLIKAN